MKQPRGITSLLVLAALTAVPQFAKDAIELGGVPCADPPVLHCPDANCSGPTVIEQGPAVEAKTGRNFFLDYPCDLKPNEKVTFILSLHGAGSYGNWQRHYFPLLDYVKKYRLVVATPNSPTRIWSESDDQYLQNIVNLIYDQVGQKNIQAFWLVGHSQGGATSNRLLRTPFFAQRVDGWLSLSGGRLGPPLPRPAVFLPAAAGAAGKQGKAGPAAAKGKGAGRGTVTANGRGANTTLPDADFSFIFETGQHELDDKPIPATPSPWADKYGCSARVQRKDVTDSKPGYVYDSTRQDPGSDAWGRLPRPGKAQVYEYPRCKDGYIVADVVRIGKGHTEGLEPKITEQLIKMMLSAKN